MTDIVSELKRELADALAEGDKFRAHMLRARLDRIARRGVETR